MPWHWHALALAALAAHHALLAALVAAVRRPALQSAAQAATELELAGGGDCADAEEANKEGELIVAAAAGHRC